MKVTTYGTRGSIPVASKQTLVFGGNTTCLRIMSDCLPKGTALVVDAGTGYRPLSRDLLGEGVKEIALLFTHYHADHTQGLPLAAHTHIPDTLMRVWGPVEYGKGPAEVLEDIMSPPHFPVDFAKVRDRFRCKNYKCVGTEVLVIHPIAGYHLLSVSHYRESLAQGKQLNLGRTKYDLGECLVVWMHKTVHPECTVSYRFEEKPSGRVFVFLTDHENTDGLPRELVGHVKGAHLLIQDGQYARTVYRDQTAGYGHGTPDYCARLAHAAGVTRLGITHHDPAASDDEVRLRVEEAKQYLLDQGQGILAEQVFGCADYEVSDV